MNKPVILLGNGIRGNPELVAYLCSLNIPILTTWMFADALPEDSPAFCGRPGIYGQRAANIIQQKATHLYAFGARLDEQQVAYRYDRFGGHDAIMFIYDIDQAELDKLPNNWGKYNKPQDMPLVISDPSWLAWCRKLYADLRPELEGVNDPQYVDPFCFVSVLSDYAQPEDIIIAGAGKAGEILCQTFKVKAGQRFQTLSTCGAMGYDIPLAIGACIASGRRVLCVTGDGGFQLNTQELEVIRRLDLPIHFFVHSNNGYGSIRAMQKLRFDGNVVGADPASGFTIPSLEKLARCYGLTFEYYYRTRSLERGGFDANIIELHIDPAWLHYPRVATSLVDGKWQQDSMEDMLPRLPGLDKLMEWDGEKAYAVERWD